LNKQIIFHKLCLGQDPWNGITFPKHFADPQGWNSDNELLADSIHKLKPKVIFETGVWKGASCIHMAKILKDICPDGVVIANDTWLGCDILRMVPEWVPSLKMEWNRPNVWQTFYANVIKEQLQDMILPLHMHSTAGVQFCKKNDVWFDMAHHDATHMKDEVYLDLKKIWSNLRPGGHLIVDDYIPNVNKFPDGHPMNFQGVVDDVDKFAKEKGIPVQVCDVKARMVKSESA
jgi:hypothetical protein